VLSTAVDTQPYTNGINATPMIDTVALVSSLGRSMAQDSVKGARSPTSMPDRSESGINAEAVYAVYHSSRAHQSHEYAAPNRALSWL